VVEVSAVVESQAEKSNNKTIKNKNKIINNNNNNNKNNKYKKYLIKLNK
jgi:hypothetical protein